MYDAKARGGGRCEVFDASMHQRVVDRVSLETRLRHAIEQQRLRTFFQPIIDLRSGELHGLEALARWPAGDEPVPRRSSSRSPRRSGLIGALGVLILRSACETLSDWRGRGVVAPEVTVSVNVSIRQITEAAWSSTSRRAARTTSSRPPTSCWRSPRAR